MVHALESVTLAVRRLETAVDLLRDQFGLTVVRDTRASVGLLSAWRHPVHESVRLVELAKDSQPIGRLRLGYYEDRRTDPADAAPDPALSRESVSAGPALLEFRGSGEAPLKIAASGPIRRLEGLAPVAVLGKPAGGLHAVWILAPDWERAARFYTEVLGYVCHERADLTAEAARDLWGTIAAHERPSLRAAAFFAPGTTLGGVVLLDAPGAGPAQAQVPAEPGRPGIRFLTCRCDDLDGVLDRLPGLGIDPLTPPSHVGLPNGKPARVMLIRSPSA